MISDGDTFSIPEVTIMEFGKDSVTTYNFDKIYSLSNYSFAENILKIKDSIFGRVQFLSPDRVMITAKANTPLRFVKLYSTKTDLTFDDVDQLKFNIKWDNEFIQVDLADKKQEFPEIKLEKIDSNYFISIFEFGNRRLVLPIGSVNFEEIKIYGFPREPFEITTKIKL